MVSYSTNSSGLIIPTQELISAIEELKRGFIVTLCPLSYDMAPCFRGGRDALTLMRCHHLRTGQIVLSQTMAGLALHRVVRIDTDGLVTLMGDASSFELENCYEKDVIARVVEIRDVRTMKRRPLSGPLWWRIYRPVRNLLRGHV